MGSLTRRSSPGTGDTSALHRTPKSRHGGEVVTRRSAKPLCAGSIPARASRGRVVKSGKHATLKTLSAQAVVGSIPTSPTRNKLGCLLPLTTLPPVAQLVEQWPLKPTVEGSTPSGRTWGAGGEIVPKHTEREARPRRTAKLPTGQALCFEIPFVCERVHLQNRAGGEIGRRARFRTLCPKGRASSSLALPTSVL